MLRLAWCVILFGVVLSGGALLAAPPQVGDTVQVQWAGKPVAAEVVSVNPRNGWVTVKFTQNGVALKPTLPPDKIFADEKALATKVRDEETEFLDLLRTNSDGKNVSSDEQYLWHAPGRGGQKQGPLLVKVRVKAYRAGSLWVLLEEQQGEKTKDHLVRIEEISNTDRKHLFDMVRKKRR